MVALSKTSVHSFDIAESVKKVGQLTPRLLDKFGNEIDGKHRNILDNNWKTVVLENIDTPEKLILARFHSNYHRRDGSNDLSQAIRDLLTLYSGQNKLDSEPWVQNRKGREPNELLHRIAEALSVSYKTVLKYAPLTFKQKTPIKTKKSVEGSSTKKPSKQGTLIETPNILTATFPNCKCKECIHNATCK